VSLRFVSFFFWATAKKPIRVSVVSQSLPVSHLSGILVIYVVGSVVFVFSIGISMVSMLCFCSMFFFF